MAPEGWFSAQKNRSWVKGQKIYTFLGVKRVGMRVVLQQIQALFVYECYLIRVKVTTAKIPHIWEVHV